MQGVVTLPALFSLAEAATEEFEETEVEEDKEDPSEFLKQRQKFFALKLCFSRSLLLSSFNFLFSLSLKTFCGFKL